MRLYLKKLRKEKHLTQQDVADKLGLAQNSYSMIESGERQKKISMEMAQKLADVFGTSLEYICEQETKIG